MGIIKDNKKFDRKTDQKNPVNPEGVANKTSNKKTGLDSETINEQKSKK